MAIVKDKDNGYKALFKRLGAPPRVLSVGILEGGNVAAYGAANEFGINVPERSFIRAWADENEARNIAVLRGIGRAVVAGKFDADTGLERAGLAFAGSMKQRIASGIGPPNAPSTIARKGDKPPLIDTGILRSAITHEVT